MSQIPLTLRRRLLALTLAARNVALTLRQRTMALTLPDRKVAIGETPGALANNMILQGLSNGGGINTKVFLLYGLVSDYYDDYTNIPLTLRRRKLALTLGD